LEKVHYLVAAPWPGIRGAGKLPSLEFSKHFWCYQNLSRAKHHSAWAAGRSSEVGSVLERVQPSATIAKFGTV
jgi:hypothetical protein